MTRPAIYDVLDETEVPIAAATTRWAAAAVDRLRETAHSYNAVITSADLARQIQASTGVRTRTLVSSWIGAVLEQAAELCASTGEPVLTSLCVQSDGTVGEGFATALRKSRQRATKDIEMDAAHARVECYRRYATDFPANGGRAMLTKGVETARGKVRSRVDDPPGALCPIHHIAVPASGICDDCA